MATQYYNLIGTREYATIHNVSIRTAQRLISKLPGAVKSTGNKWVAPIPSTQYAKALNVSAKTARRRGEKASSPTDATKNLQGTLRQRAAIAWYQYLVGAGTRKPPAYSTIENRFGHADRKQLQTVLNTPPLASDANDDEWLGDDNLSILFYH